jgi:hypothetical protein
MADEADVIAAGLHLLEAGADRQEMHVTRRITQHDATTTR